jgi:hypothetical protein
MRTTFFDYFFWRALKIAQIFQKTQGGLLADV